jgi:hypothetical protein
MVVKSPDRAVPTRPPSPVFGGRMPPVVVEPPGEGAAVAAGADWVGVTTTVTTTGVWVGTRVAVATTAVGVVNSMLPGGAEVRGVGGGSPGMQASTLRMPPCPSGKWP